jgi:hypothetical protein
MLIYHRCCLRAAVAIRAVEIEGGDAVLAESAFERGAAIHRFGCVISHIFIVVLLPGRALGNRCATFLQEMLSLGGTHSCFRYIICPVAQDTQLPRDEERRLLAISVACSAEERAVADQLLHPRHSLLYPEYMRLVDAYQAIRIECRGKWLAVRTHRKKMRDEGK